MATISPSPDAFFPIGDGGIFGLRPDFRAISICVSGFEWTEAVPLETEAFIESAGGNAAHSDAERDAHLASWKEAYRAFDAKPKKMPCSAEALLKRTALPRINPLVDVYKAVSVMHGLPVGGEDRNLYAGQPRLCRATGDEPFDCVNDGENAVDYPDAGEVIWRDDLGVTCRRWNWRQGTRTRIEPGASELWFILEALDGLPDERLKLASDQFTSQIAVLSPNALCNVSYIGFGD